MAMARLRTKRRGGRPIAIAICLGGLSTAALAQQLGPLRGTIDAQGDAVPARDGAMSAMATDPRPTGAIPSAPYQPVSQGAVPEARPAADLDGGIGLATIPDDPASRPEPGQSLMQAGGADEDEPDDAALLGPAEPLDAGRNEAADPLNLPAGPQGHPRRERDDDPYAPTGLRIGTFEVFPQVEQGITTTDNADQSPTGDSAVLSETTLRVKAASNWSKHTASLDAYGTVRKTLSGQDISDFEIGLSSALQLDISSNLRGLASFDYTVAPEDASSPVSIVGVEDRPLHHVIGGSIGAEKALGKLRLRATGNVVRDQFGDATLEDGSMLPQDDRNDTLASLTLRGGYEVSPALTPFVEAELGRRFYDEERDAAGFARSATRVGARAGITLDLREKLTGEFSAGWISEDPEDSRLATISGPTVAAGLAWSPVRTVTVKLDGATTVEGTTTPGESGSILYSGVLSAERQMRADLTGSAALGFGWRRYDTGGHDTIASAEAALTWWLNRYAGVTGRARYELLRSDLADRDYDAASVFLGLTVQR